MKEGENPERLLREIGNRHHLEVAHIAPLAGGDINRVFKIITSTGSKFAVKLNDPGTFPGMFEAEKKGLEKLADSGTFTIPEVIATGIENNNAYLLLEFIESSSPISNFWRIFGERLAKLHRKTNKFFGFEGDNYIGTLPQRNAQCDTAAEFYITQRLEPQFKLAKLNGYSLGNPSALYKTCSEIIPDEPPSLIHGDLWSGNYLPDAKGLPGLIDPAVAYAPREMDLAMMKLFGGFEEVGFESYNSEFPLQADWEKRISLWQLYYLLVHLNIFGEGYKSRVSFILNRYS